MIFSKPDGNNFSQNKTDIKNKNKIKSRFLTTTTNERKIDRMEK